MFTDIIDTHVHFWKYDSSHPDFEWIDEKMEALQQDFLPPQHPFFATQDSENSIKCVAIQARQNLGETTFLLDLAKEYDMIAGVVGWVDWQDTNLQQTLQKLSEHQKLKGFRHIIQGEKSGFMLQPKFDESIALLGDRYTYDLLLKPAQLQEAFTLAQRHPQIRFVIDHLAKPDFTSEDNEGWKKDIQQFAKLENVYCKLSGMVTEAQWKAWHINDFMELIAVCKDTFGVDRLMYGSDWPVCLLSGTYYEVENIISQFMAQLSSADHHKIMYANAQQFYKL